jgi:peptidoglycan/xylan/chitin deacetylase (PgdA/CDA1 family)
MVASIRRFMLLAVAGVLHHFGALRLWQTVRWRQRGKRVACVLGLHRVLSEEDIVQSKSQYGIVLRERTFARLLEYLARRFHVVSLSEFMDNAGEIHRGSKPICLITFDDGWMDNYTVALPHLEKLKLPATIFLVTGLVESQGLFWVERLHLAWEDPAGREGILSDPDAAPIPSEGFDQIVERLKRMPADQRAKILARVIPSHVACAGASGIDRLMRWEEVSAMSSRGIEFGTHTVNHPLLTYESDATVEDELRSSKQALEFQVKREVRSFAYPNGDWDERVRRWVERTGYRCAFTTRLGWHDFGDDPFTIRRVMIHERNVTGLGGEFSPALCSFTLARNL